VISLERFLSFEELNPMFPPPLAHYQSLLRVLFVPRFPRCFSIIVSPPHYFVRFLFLISWSSIQGKLLHALLMRPLESVPPLAMTFPFCLLHDSAVLRPLPAVSSPIPHVPYDRTGAFLHWPRHFDNRRWLIRTPSLFLIEANNNNSFPFDPPFRAPRFA